MRFSLFEEAINENVFYVNEKCILMVQQTKHSVTEKHVPVLITGAGAAGLSHVANAAAARHSFVTD